MRPGLFLLRNLFAEALLVCRPAATPAYSWTLAPVPDTPGLFPDPVHQEL
jgi:hypothetical protein